MIKASELHQRWMKDPTYRSEYEALDEEYQLARTLIEARTRAGLSQTELAKRMNTSQSYMARLESGKVQPSTAALARFARATGCKLRIEFEPLQAIPDARSMKASSHSQTRASSVRPKKRKR